MAPRKSWPRRLKVALIATCLSLLLLEGVVRIRQWIKYGTTSSTFYELAHDPVSGLEIPAPYSEVGPIQINSRGHRSPEIENPKPPGRLRVAFLGGSTSFCAEASRLETTWPHLLVESLKAAAPQVAFDYVNGGAAGYSTEQSLINLEHRISPLEPDVIVIYHATNDFTQDSRRLASERGLYDLSRRETSSLGEYWLTWALIEKNLRFRSRMQRAGGDTYLEFEPAELSPPFRERLTLLIERAKEVAPVVCIATFAHKPRAGQPEEALREAASSSLYYMPFLNIEGILTGFDEYNQVIREVATATNIILIEGEDDIPADDEHFNDSVHFMDAGLALQAERILAGIMEAEAYQELVRSKKR